MTVVRARKRLGQNFLISAEIINRIISDIGPCPFDTIVEIGPGRGALTKPLAESGARIVGVEFDRGLCRKLESELGGKSNVKIIEKDFLKFNPSEHGLETFKLCGNIPFNITSPVIDWIVEHRDSISKAVIMIQREVALRLSSKPGGKDWSPLAIMTQLYFDIGILFDVGPKHFKPSPEVTSSVVELIPKKEIKVEHFLQFERLVRSSFKQRRKLLINNLVPSIIPTVQAAEEVIGELGLTRKVRAEEVSTVQFLELTELLIQHNML
jgi:16S rRNA (adenine1518-N6/adenine1519-N6)-dimethyltransferase